MVHDILFNKRIPIIRNTVELLIDQVSFTSEYSLCCEEAECHSVSMKISSVFRRATADLPQQLSWKILTPEEESYRETRAIKNYENTKDLC